ncbi:hypothetical protein Tco_0711150 [Tanacetum coccineum]
MTSKLNLVEPKAELNQTTTELTSPLSLRAKVCTPKKKEESPCLMAKASQIQEQDSHSAKSSSSVGLTTAPKMVINSPCLNGKKELAISEQTATGKESTNPLMADSLPKTIMPTKLVKPQGFNLRPNMDVWRGDTALKHMYPRMYMLESCKSVKNQIEGVLLANTRDWWISTLEGSGDFSVASVRKLIDDKTLPETTVKTRWIKAVPIKVNVHAWKVSLDCLPARINISRRDREMFRKISRWWDVSYMDIHSYEEWVAWIVNLRLSTKYKKVLEDVNLRLAGLIG